MNICITGALGHIGSKLIRNLDVPASSKVYLVDNMLTQRYASLFDLPQKPNFEFHELDIASDKMEPIIKKSQVVIHLAAITDAQSSVENKKLVDRVNRKGFKHVADLCAKYKTPLMFPSTTSVYGSQSDIVDETCKELKPQSPYADSKLYAENYLKKLGKTKKLKYVIFRFGTIFGYSIGMRFHTAVNRFIFQAANKQPITVWRTAYDQKRPYCDLDDAIDAINYAMKKKIFDREIYNIVTKNYTVRDIVKVIKKYIPRTKITYVDSRIMNQLSYNVENKKSLTRGFSYRGSLDHSVRMTISKLDTI